MSVVPIFFESNSFSLRQQPWERKDWIVSVCVHFKQMSDSDRDDEVAEVRRAMVWYFEYHNVFIALRKQPS